MKTNNKEIEEARRQCAAADIHMAYNFRHPHYTHNGFDQPTHRSEMGLVIGATYILIDGNCESHFVPFYAKFVKIVERGPFLNSKDYMLFRVIEDGNGINKDDYFLALPSVRVEDSVCGGGPRILLELTAEHHPGKNPNKKIIIKEEEYI